MGQLHYRIVLSVVLSLGTLASAGCTRSRGGGATNLPAPTVRADIGPGDMFEVSVVGEKDIPREFRVQPDGTIDFPYLDRITVAGLEPQQIEEMIKAGLMEHKILAHPQVTVVVRAFVSKKVNIVGAVAKPGTVAWSDGLKLAEAISAAGGLANLADGDHVRITRLVGPNKTVTSTVSIDDITDGRLADVPLQAGDTIKVDQRVF
jgi:protein involved in polysaccharide export with SLBB domain